MKTASAGILLYRCSAAGLEVLLGHPGGPYWHSRDEGAWMIPKGLIQVGETALAAAKREFHEETGIAFDVEPWPLCRIAQKGGKQVELFALEGDLDPDQIESNRFEIEWPPRSRKIRSFAEIDRAAWFAIERARVMILPSQGPALDALECALPGRP